MENDLMYIYTYRYRNQYPPTAVALATELGWEIGNILHYYQGGRYNGPIVCWGKSTVAMDLNILNHNAPKDKLTAFQEMNNANVCVPQFLTPPYVTRARRHRGGNDIREYSRNRFPVQAIDKDKEYRVEVFRGGVFRAHIKYPPASPVFNWNRSNTEWRTFGYTSLREAIGADAIELGKAAVSSLGYDFGAVDIIRERDTGKLYVLEVNSAPALDDVGVRKYANRIRRWVGELND